MTTVSASNTTQANGSTAASTAAGSRAKLSGNFDTFLKLLTTQLQYQDPLEPMDSAQFTQQLVQYSQVEQQIDTNSKLESLLSMQQASSTNQALGYLGTQVTAETRSLALQNKKASFSVALESDAPRFQVSISDAKTGKVVRTLTTSGAAGVQNFTWDGKDTNGNQLADGAYTIAVAASKNDGAAVKSAVKTSGIVTGIDIDSSGNNVLKLGDVVIGVKDVRSVGIPATGT